MVRRSVTQTDVNEAALRSAAARLTESGYRGDAHRFVEGLVLAVLAEGYRPIEKPPTPTGPGSSAAAREKAKAELEAAVRAIKDARKKPKETAA